MRRRLRPDDSAVAGVVAGILMLGALVAFLAYVNAVWVPAYVANKEASAASDASAAMQGYADAAEDRIARGVTNRSFSRTIPLGVAGIPVLGAGASSGEMAVESGPRMNVTLGGTWVLNASGDLALTTRTTRYPNQTLRYELGAMEIAQPEGSWVDLRNVLAATRTTGGQLNVTLQFLNVTGAPQSVAGSSAKQAAGTVTLATTTTYGAGNVRINVTGLASAGAWRAAINRTLGAGSLSGEYAADCSASSKSYCFTSATNTATAVDVTLLNVASGWTATYAVVAAEVRS